MRHSEPAYEKLKFYQNICEIRSSVHKITKRWNKGCLRLVEQMRDAARSAKQNIRDGYGKDTAGEFAHSIRISRGSLKELEGDIDDCYEDELIEIKEYSSLKKILGQTIFQIDRYLDSLYTLDKLGKWKKRFKR